MKNKKFIAKIFNNFEKNEDISKDLKRLSNNFNIEDDEYRFAIETKVAQPYKQIAEQMIERGDAHLVWDNPLKRDDFDIDSTCLTISISATSLTPELLVEGDEDIDIEDSYITRTTRYRINEKGGISSSVGTIKGTDRHYVKGIVKVWLSSQFGATDH